MNTKTRTPLLESVPLRRFLMVAGAAFLGASACRGLDLTGAAYLHRYAARYATIIASEQARAARYHRAVMFAEPVEQNAAVWYRSAFANLNSLPSDTMKSLRPQTDRGTTHVPVLVRARFRDRCVEAWGPTMSEALRSTRCDWQLGYQLDSSTLIDFYPAAPIVAYCKMLEGDLRAEQQDWLGAARSYLETASFGSDMDQGMFGMNLAGVSSAKFGLEALGRLVGAIDDKAVLAAVWNELSKLDGRMPTLNRGLRLVHIWLMARIADQARVYIGRHEHGIDRVVPWQAIAAWRVSRYESLLSHLDEAVQATDPARRQRIAIAIQNDIAEGHGDVVGAELPARWDQLTNEASQVDRPYRAVQAAIRLQEWYLDHGVYPDDASGLQWPVGATALRYVRSKDGQGYKLIAADQTAVIVLERSVD